jgi:hypothetical protein
MTIRCRRNAVALVLASALVLEPLVAKAEPPTEPEAPASEPEGDDAEPDEEAAEEPTPQTEPEADVPPGPEPGPQAEADVPPPMPPPPQDVASPPPIDSRSCEKNGKDVCKPMKIGGAVSLAIGLAALGVGLGLMFVDSKRIDEEPAFERAFRPTGVVLMGGGFIASTFGAFLIGEAIQRRRGPKARFAGRLR